MSSSEDVAISSTGTFPSGTLAAAGAEGANDLGILAAGAAFRPAGSLEPEDPLWIWSKFYIT